VPLSLKQIKRALNGEINGDHVRAPGPEHSAADRSLSVKITDNGEDVVVNTFSAADDRLACLKFVREKCGIQPKASGKDKFSLDVMVRAAMLAAESRKPIRKTIAVYDYSDADGTVLYQKRRYSDPNHKFDCWRPDGNGGWINGMRGVDRRVLYRLPDVLKGGMVFFCEGEKDADNLAALELCTTTIVGAGSWTEECVQSLKDRDVVIMRDNDDAGIKRAQEAAEHLHGVASRLRVCLLPDLGPKGDVTNWIEAGGTVDQLQRIIENVPDWQPSDAPTVPTAAAAPTKNAGALASNVAVSVAAPKAPAISDTITLSFFSDLVEAKSKPWLIKNVIARGECSSWIAPPGKGKSALLTDIFVHGARCAEWRGYRVKAAFGGIYFALERVDLVKRRMTAHRLRDNLPPDLPIAVVGQVIDLMSRKSVGNIVDAIKRAEDHFGCNVGLVTFDTWAKGIAAGGGDESSAKDQNVALANLRRVLDKLNVHIATIGHTGKDESRGERGSNAKLADVDLQVQLTGDTIRSAVIKKANDQPEGVLTSFRLEPYEFDLDEDGDQFRTFIVFGETISDAVAQTGKLSDQQQRAIEALAEVTLSHGVDLPATDGMPAGLKTVTTDQWRAELYRRGVLDQTVKNPRARFFELRNRLAAKHLIGVRDELVWLARKGP
jgi:hypothetical protein